MCCRKNRIAYAAPTAAFQADPYNSSSYGPPAFQGRRGCCGGQQRGRGGPIVMIVRAIREKREAKKQAQLMVDGTSVEKDSKMSPQDTATYMLGYQRAMNDYKDGKKVEEYEETKEKRTSLTRGGSDMSLISGPPPTYESVERSQKGI